jgi:uncharacterized protein YdiU (UPF0061 family)
MKRLTLCSLGIAAMIALSGSAFSQMMDLGPMNEWHHFRHYPGLEREFGVIMHALHLEATVETFRVNVERVMLDAAEKKIALNEKRRETMESLKSLFKKYQSDKTVSKDIVQALKDLNGVRKEIRQINTESMTKIKALRDGLNGDIDKAIDAYLQKLSSNPDELEKLSKFIERAKMPMEINRDMGMDEPAMDEMDMD